MKKFKFTVPNRWRMKTIFIMVIAIFLSQITDAQTITFLKDLTAFKNPGKSWRMAGGVTADLNKPNVLNISQGTGILVNLPDKKHHGIDLFTRDAYGDIDLELDYMMAKGSNSGIYLQGRYELQLEDTWGSTKPTSGNNGGIYERWDDSRPEGHKGYDGYAPRQNASRAPGLWQHLKISFQAPRFDGSGKKVAPAKMLRIELNGVLIHENVELAGPTRGGIGKEEATGPLRIQGDHGAVAFRNIQVTEFDKPREEEKVSSRWPRVYPILVDAASTPVFRSFMDLPSSQRVVHAVSVGSEEKVHYTYDMDTGMILQVWRGDFLDATPMWHSRGDGSSRPVGTVQRFGDPLLAIAQLPSAQSEWKKDTTGTGFRPKGYTLEDGEKPVFHYRTNGSMVADAVNVLDHGVGISREITIKNPAQNLYTRLAEGKTIVETEKGMYLIDGNAYYLRLDDAGGAKPIVRDANGSKELIIPVSGKLKYSILF